MASNTPPSDPTPPDPTKDPSIPKDTTNHLARLPTELRLDIYELAFTHYIICAGTRGSGRAYTAPLLLTSKQIRNEATSLYISHLRHLSQTHQEECWAADTSYRQGNVALQAQHDAGQIADKDFYKQRNQLYDTWFDTVNKAPMLQRMVRSEITRFQREQGGGIGRGRLPGSVASESLGRMLQQMKLFYEARRPSASG